MTSNICTNVLTNEETCVSIYTKVNKPTVASAVTTDTRLEDLNLNWSEGDLPQRERTKHVHRLHPYLGKYIPQLAEVFLRKFFRTGQTILDPFSGSGTTLLQANELGMNAIGCDISEFNVLLAGVKTAKYDVTVARKEVFDVLEKVEQATQSSVNQPQLWSDAVELPELGDSDSTYLKTWFAPKALIELLTYRNIVQHGDYQYGDLLKVILSRSARSARLTTHFDLDFPRQPQAEPYWCYKHRRHCQPTTEAFKFLRRYSLDTLKRIEEFSALRTDAAVQVVHADSREVDIPRVDGVITSPPYVGLIDYHEQHRYAYELLGLVDSSVREIGAASNGSSKKAKQQYQEDIANVFRPIASRIRSGGRMIVVAGDRHNLYPDIAREVGVEVEAELVRQVTRRTGRRASEFYESVFIWRVS